MLFMNSEPEYSAGQAPPEIDHRARVGMAAAGRVGAAVAAVRVGAQVVPVVGDGLDVVVRVRIEMLARLALVAAALNHVVEMGDDAGGDEHLAVCIEIDAPGVAGAVGEDLEDVARRDGSARCRR